MRLWFNQLFYTFLMRLLMHRQHGPFQRPSSATSKPSDPGLNVSASPQSSAAEADACLSHERGRDQHVLLEKTEAERDEPQAKDRDCHSRDCFPSSHVGGDGDGDGQRQRGVRELQGDNDGGMMESTGDSTSVWSSLDLDMNCGHSEKGESCAYTRWCKYFLNEKLLAYLPFFPTVNL